VARSCASAERKATGVPRHGSEGDSSAVFFQSAQDNRFESVALNAVMGPHDAPKMSLAIRFRPTAAELLCGLAFNNLIAATNRSA
jgi:hypothetical protein